MNTITLYPQDFADPLDIRERTQWDLERFELRFLNKRYENGEVTFELKALHGKLEVTGPCCKVYVMYDDHNKLAYLKALDKAVLIANGAAQ